MSYLLLEVISDHLTYRSSYCKALPVALVKIKCTNKYFFRRTIMPKTIQFIISMCNNIQKTPFPFVYINDHYILDVTRRRSHRRVEISINNEKIMDISLRKYPNIYCYFFNRISSQTEDSVKFLDAVNSF